MYTMSRNMNIEPRMGQIVVGIGETHGSSCFRSAAITTAASTTRITRIHTATGRWHRAMSRTPMPNNHAPCAHPKTSRTLATERAAKKFCLHPSGKK